MWTHLKLPRLTQNIIGASVAGLALLAQPASSLEVTAEDIINAAEGTNFVELAGADVSATGGNFNGFRMFEESYVGLGISGGTRDHQIDLNGESLIIDFDNAMWADAIELGALYEAGSWAPGSLLVDEAAVVTAFLGDSEVAKGILQIIDANSASWSGPGGSLLNLSPSSTDNGGVWEITDPFGEVAFNRLVFGAQAVGDAPNGQNSSVVFNSVTAYSPPQVPEPGTAALLCLGLTGLGLARRNRRPVQNQKR